MAEKVDLRNFVKVYGETHAAGGTVSEVAEITGLKASQVSQLSGKLRKWGINMPLFARGRRTMVLTDSVIAELNDLL